MERTKTRPFAVRYRHDGRLKLSALRFAAATEAQEYAHNLIECGAIGVSIVELDGRRYVSSRSIVRRYPR